MDATGPEPPAASRPRRPTIDNPPTAGPTTTNPTTAGPTTTNNPPLAGPTTTNPTTAGSTTTNNPPLAGPTATNPTTGRQVPGRRGPGTWSRREFVLATGAGALAACSGGGGGNAKNNGKGSGPGEDAKGKEFDPGDWGSVRDQFSLDPDLRHFAAFVFASHPRPVADAIKRHREGLDADTEGYIQANEGDAEYAVRVNAAAYLGGDEMSTALTDSTTMGLGLLYGGMRLAEGDTVLTTEHDFFSTHEALRLRSERTGATVDRVTLYDDPASADAGDMVDRLVAAVTPATRVVAVTWVHSGTGVKLPVPDLAEALHAAADRAGAEPPLLCVDGVHGLGSEATKIADLGCDFFVSGTHKWLFGPGIVTTPEDVDALVEAVAGLH